MPDHNPHNRTDSNDLSRLRNEYTQRQQRLMGSDLYSPFNLANLFATQQRQREVLRLLKRNGITDLSGLAILELGSGAGGVLREFNALGASTRCLFGCDLLPERLTQAQRFSPGLPLVCADGQNLPYPSAAFDLLLQYTVFTSVLDINVKANLAAEMLRVLKPNGLILWYDFWLNPTNSQTHGIRPYEIQNLFPGCSYEFKRITLAPPIARRLVRISWAFCALLEKLKLLNSHYLVAIQHTK